MNVGMVEARKHAPCEMSHVSEMSLLSSRIPNPGLWYWPISLFSRQVWLGFGVHCVQWMEGFII